MECAECEMGEATLTKVEYQVEETETIPLCTDCRDVFRDGGFVEEVSPVDQ